MNKNFILLVGASGSGKTTICKQLYEKYGLSAIESYTTRPPRCKNEEGHIFIDDYDADEILQNKEIVGYTDFNNYRYFATAEQVKENQIYVIDVAGVEFFDEHYTGSKKIIVVYVDVDVNVRYQRMCQSRTEAEASERIQYDKEAFKEAPHIADFIVKNDNLEDAVCNIYKIWKDA